MQQLFKILFAAIFIAGGVNHFLNPKVYLSIMPPYLPWHLFLVYLSGFFEVALGVLLLVPAFQTLAAWGLIALLVAIFPANLHMALNAQDYANIPTILLWLRLPLQALLIWWAYSYVGV